MKILLSYPAESDKGEGVHYARVLERLGHQVVTINTSAESRSSVDPQRKVIGFPPGVAFDDVLSHVGSADLFIYVEPLGLIPLGMERSPVPTVCVISDVHRNLKSRQTLSLLFDHVFLYQQNYLSKFDKHPREAVHWFPWSCDSDVFRDLGCIRDLDVAFVGQLFGPRSPRRRVVEELNRRVKLNEQRYYLQREIPGIYSRAKIVINLPIGHDLNCRVFEAMSCGSLLLTTREDNGQEDLFQEGIHYVAFDRQGELFEKVDHFLKAEVDRQKIARAGHDLVMSQHTVLVRLQELLAKVQSGPRGGAPVRGFSRSEVLALYAAVYERNGWVEALLKLAADKRAAVERSVLLARSAKSFLRRAVRGW